MGVLMANLSFFGIIKNPLLAVMLCQTYFGFDVPGHRCHACEFLQRSSELIVVHLRITSIRDLHCSCCMRQTWAAEA